MAGKEFLFTYDGLRKMESRLDYLKSSVRHEIADRIKQALSFGDISENSEYDEAKNEQAKVETEIAQLEYKLKNAKLIDEDEVETDAVNIGTTVKLLDIDLNEVVEYTIVGSEEADPSRHRISNESPAGLAIVGKHPGEVAEVSAPAGLIKFKIMGISKVRPAGS